MDEPTYDAFISYRNAPPDSDVAERLRILLEHFRIPRDLRQGRPPKLRCFLDRLELPASRDLPETLKSALARSRFLILLCSPAAAASEWIAREIRFFEESGGRANILVVLLAGSESTSIPPALEGTPLYLDVRAGTAAQSVKALRSRLLHLIAPILGCPLDHLIQRHRKETRTRRWIAALGILLVLAAFALLASFAADESRAKERERRTATARRLMGHVLSERGQRADLLPIDILLAIESLRLAPTPEARAYLQEAIRKLPRLRGRITDVHVDALAFGEPARSPRLPERVRDVTIESRVLRIAHGGDGSGLAAFTSDGELLADVSDQIRVWNAATGAEVAQIRHGPSVCGAGVNRLSFSHDHRLLAIAGVDGDFAVWDLDTGEESFRQQVGTVFDPEVDVARAACEEPVRDVAFSPDDRMLATSNPDGTTRIWDIRAGRQIALVTAQAVTSLTFSHRGDFLATGGPDGAVRIWATGPRWQEVARASHDDAVTSLAFTSDDALLATSSADFSARLWDVGQLQGDYDYRRYREDVAGQTYPQVAQVQPLEEVLRVTHDGAVTAVAVSPDDRQIATIDDDGRVRLWDAIRRAPATRDDQTLIQAVCSSLTRNLTASEWRQYIGNEPYRKSCTSLP